jgi:glucokinase
LSRGESGVRGILYVQLLAYDIGGSHASAGVVDRKSLTIRWGSSRPIDSAATAESIINELHLLGTDVLSEASPMGVSPDGIAFAVPGPFDYEQGVSRLRHKFAALYDVNLRREFESRFQISGARITFLNDAQAFLLGECHAGAGNSVHRCVGITLGTGVGSAFALDGSIVDHGPGVPHGGEVYCLPWDGGTVEDTISTRAIQRRYRLMTGEDKTVRDICFRAPEDPAARLVMRDFGASLGHVLREICMPYRPDAVVLGGAISRSADLFLPAAASALQEPPQILRPSQLLDKAALIGAAVRCAEALLSNV